MAEQPSPDDAMFARFFSGESDAPERAYVERWIAADPSRGPLAEHLRTIWGRAVDSDQAFDLPGIWRRLAHELSPRVGRRALSVRTALAPHTGPQGMGVRASAAAWAHWLIPTAVTAVVAAGLGVAVWRIAASRPVPQPFREFSTAPGSRATIALGDGSRLVLAPATRLRVPAAFGSGTSRTVELEGEAYFVVVHDAVHPFMVRTARTLVRDVGTTFVIRAYRADYADRVVVQEGRVSLVANAAHARGHTPSVPASPTDSPLRTGDVAVIADTSLTIIHDASLVDDLAWTQGRLVFKGTPLRDAAQDIARAFDLDIIVADSVIAGRHLTAEFGDDPVDDVLTEVAHAVGARYERTGRKVVLRLRGAATRQDGPVRRVPIAMALMEPKE